MSGVEKLVRGSIGVHRSTRRRHHEGTKMSHFEGGWDRLCSVVRDNLLPSSIRKGKYPGSLRVKIADPTGFMTKAGAQKSCRGQVHKKPAKKAQVVIWTPETFENQGLPIEEEDDLMIMSIEAY